MDETTSTIAKAGYDVDTDNGVDPDKLGSRRRRLEIHYVDKRPILSERVFKINRFAATLGELEGSPLEAGLIHLEEMRRNVEGEAKQFEMQFPYTWITEERRYKPLFRRRTS